MNAQSKTTKSKTDILSSLTSGPMKWVGIVGFGALVLLMIINAALTKPQGTQFYGICKTFIELNVPYPTTLHITEVLQYTYSVQVYFYHTDPFGSTRSEMVECGFAVVGGQTQLASILRNRKAVDENTVEDFNKTMGAVVGAEMDLTLPPRLDGSIESLKR
jgi:hypothetical protein